MNIIEKITESIFFKDLIAKINSLIDNSNEVGGKVEFLEEIDTSKFEYLDKLEEVDSKASKTELSNAVTTHNTSDTAHSDIRLLIQGLATRLNALADSDDVTLDQMSEIVTYIKANKSLIESITTDKVSISDIINNLETNSTNRPLSAAQGVALKRLVDALWAAKNSGELDGYTPIRGTDYWTPEDIEQINLDSENFIIEELAKRGQLKPEFANNYDECIDTTKLYVLPDGYIHAYMLTKFEGGAAYTNLADPNSTEWKDGYRISSSSISAQSGKTVCNPITCKIGDVIRVKGVSFVANADRAVLQGYRASDNTSLFSAQYVSALPDTVLGYELMEDGTHKFTILSTAANTGFTSETADFRCAFDTPSNPEDIVITVNEEIVETESSDTYAWVNTNHAFVPANYEPRIIELEEKTAVHETKITHMSERLEVVENNTVKSNIPNYWETAIKEAKDKIIAKQALGGVNCLSFVWTSDIHAKKSDDTKGVRFGIVAKAIMDETDTSLFVSTGDLMSQTSYADVTEVYTEETLVKKWLSPIPYYHQALIMGNHDGVWGDASSGYYCKQLSLDIMYNLIYRKQAMDLRRVSGENGTYYYLDNLSQKTRFIFLNSNNTPDYEENSDGTAVYDRFNASCYGQTQLDWLTDVALDMPEGYVSCIFSHEPYAGDWSQLVGIVDAYNTKGVYSNSFVDSDNEWRSSTISVNYSNAKGEIAAVFAGHVHYDYVRHIGNNPMYSTCPLITITTSLGGDVRQSPNGEELLTRVDETNTEFAMDIVIIDKVNRKIYMIRLGAGIDREISY